MPKKKKKKIYIPFDHENLEIKNGLIEYARGISNGKKTEEQLACALIYASISEYLAEHLLENLRYFIYHATYVNFAGILSIDERNDNRIKTMGQIIGELEKYDFPDKKEITRILREISDCRNNLFHNLAKADQEELSEIDENIKTLKDLGEEIIGRVNTIYAGLQKILIPQEAANDIKEEDSAKK